MCLRWTVHVCFCAYVNVCTTFVLSNRKKNTMYMLSLFKSTLCLFVCLSVFIFVSEFKSVSDSWFDRCV